MKLRELIIKLEKLSELEANVRFEWHEFNGLGTCCRDAELVDARIEDGHAVIRVTEPIRVEDVRRCNR